MAPVVVSDKVRADNQRLDYDKDDEDCFEELTSGVRKLGLGGIKDTSPDQKEPIEALAQLKIEDETDEDGSGKQKLHSELRARGRPDGIGENERPDEDESGEDKGKLDTKEPALVARGPDRARNNRTKNQPHPFAYHSYSSQSSSSSSSSDATSPLGSPASIVFDRRHSGGSLIVQRNPMGLAPESPPSIPDLTPNQQIRYIRKSGGEVFIQSDDRPTASVTISQHLVPLENSPLAYSTSPTYSWQSGGSPMPGSAASPQSSLVLSPNHSPMPDVLSPYTYYLSPESHIVPSPPAAQHSPNPYSPQVWDSRSYTASPLCSDSSPGFPATEEQVVPSSGAAVDIDPHFLDTYLPDFGNTVFEDTALIDSIQYNISADLSDDLEDLLDSVSVSDSSGSVAHPTPPSDAGANCALAQLGMESVADFADLQTIPLTVVQMSLPPTSAAGGKPPAKKTSGRTRNPSKARDTQSRFIPILPKPVAPSSPPVAIAPASPANSRRAGENGVRISALPLPTPSMAKDTLRARLLGAFSEVQCKEASMTVQKLPDAKLFGENEQGDTLLHVAIVNRSVLLSVYTIDRYVQTGQDRLNTANSTGQTPLLCAALTRQEDLVQYLLLSGANANQVVCFGEGDAVLHYVAKRGGTYAGVVSKLCNFPAVQAGMYNKSGLTPLLCAVESHGTRLRSTMRDGRVASLTIDSTPVIRVLLAHEMAAVRWCGTDGQTALHRAVLKHNPTLLQLLCSECPWIREVINRPSFGGLTPLHMTANLSDVSPDDQLLMARILLQHGASRLVHSIQERTAYEMAPRERKPLRQLLQSAKS